MGMLLVLAVIAVVVVLFAVGGRASNRGRPAARSFGESPALVVPVVNASEAAEPFEVVGESHYQDALEAVCGERDDDGADEDVIALLELDDGNAYDDQAVVVKVEGRTVGYLSRASARAFRGELVRLGEISTRFVCEACVVGGWDRGDGDVGHFGLQLAIGAPILCGEARTYPTTA